MRRFSFFILFLFLSVFFVNIVALPQAAGALDGRSYTLVYPEDEEAQKKIKQEITSTGIGDGNGGLETTYILVKGGILGTMQFNFDRAKSNSQDDLIYSSQIYCTLPKDVSRSSCATSAPTDKIYATFDMSIGISPGSGSDFLGKDLFRATAGAWDGGTKTLHIPNVNEPFDLDAHRKIKWKIHAQLTNNEDWKEGEFRGNDPYKLGKREANNLIKNKIMNNLVERSARVSVFQKLTEAQKNTWDTAAEAAGLTKPSEAPATAAGGAGAEGEVGVNCQGGPMGWLFCPMIDYLTDALRICAQLIEGLMEVRFLAQTGDSAKIEQGWRAFLSIANIMLVVSFMVIVFSQSTGAGLSSYGVKKMLPRLVIAAILMNISFYICALAIDVSNIVGASIMGLFIGDKGISDAMVDATGGKDGGGILGGALGGALLIGLLFLILTPVVLSIIVVFVALVARQIILLCLVLAAPLAFVAWLLPNTEKYFKKWLDLLVQLLVLYPAVMAMFGASLFFAKFLGGDGQGIDVGPGEDGSNINEILTQIIQLIVLCIPLIALPAMIKGSSNIMGKIGGYADKAGIKGIGGAKGAGKMAGKGFKKTPGIREGFESMEQRKAVREQAYGKNKALRSANRAGTSLRGRAIRGYIPTQTSRTAENIMGGQAQNAFEAIEKQEIEAARSTIRRDKAYAIDSNGTALTHLKDAHTKGDQAGVRAAFAELSSNAPGVGNLHEFITQNEGTFSSEEKNTLRKAIGDNYGDIKSKDASLTTWATDKEGGNLATAAQSAYSGLKVEELSTQRPDALKAAEKNGQITPAMANSVLTSDSQKNLNGDTREIFERIAGVSNGQGGGNPPNQPPPPGFDQTPGGLWVPH